MAILSQSGTIGIIDNIYWVGFYKTHATTIVLIHNLNTKFILSQYHIVFDDLYQSIPRASKNWKMEV